MLLKSCFGVRKVVEILFKELYNMELFVQDTVYDNKASVFSRCQVQSLSCI